MAEPGGGEFPSHPIRDRLKKAAAAATAAVTFAGGISSTGRVQETTSHSIITTTEHKTVTDRSREIYARLFSKDPEAGKLVTPSDVEAEYTKLSNLLKAGYRFNGPGKDIGVASDDDNTTINGIRTGGLGVHSEANVDLGNVRGTIYKELLDQVFQDHGMTPPEIKVYGVEAVLGEKINAAGETVMNLDTQTIKTDMAYLTKIAKQRHTSAGHLIDEYNGIDGHLPPGSEKLQGTLDRLLKGNREIIIEFNLTDEQNHIRKVIHKTKMPPAVFESIGVLTEEYAPKEPEKGGRFPEPKVKLNRGFAQPVERINQPRAQNFHKKDRTTRFPHDQHRTGRRQRP